MIKLKNKVENTYQICCDYCGQPVLPSFTTLGFVVQRGGVECPECLELVPEEIAKAYILAMMNSGEIRKQELK